MPAEAKGRGGEVRSCFFLGLDEVVQDAQNKLGSCFKKQSGRTSGRLNNVLCNSKRCNDALRGSEGLFVAPSRQD
jgi:hypothetical protein